MDPRQQQNPEQQPQPPSYGGQPPAGFTPAQPPVQQPPQPTYNNYPEPAQDQQYSVDYLNQIAAPAPTVNKKSIFLVWAIIALSIVTVLVLAAVMLFGRPSSMDRTAEVYLRMETLKSVSEEQQRYLRDNQLRANNRNYITFLTNAIRDIEQPLSAGGIKKAKLPESLRNQEAALSSQLKSQFEDARLNITLDRVYTREMTFQLSVLSAMMQGIYDQTSSTELREYLETTSSNLAPVSRSFSEFAAK